MRIPITWISDLKREDQERFKKLVIAALTSDKVFARLRALINQRLDTLVTTDADFESPSWAFKKAYQDGKRVAYTEILQLMETNNE